MGSLAHDLRLAARALGRAPGFAIAAIATLGLAIGANTALFSVAYGVLLRPLPYRDAGRLVSVVAEREFTGRDRPVQANFSLASFDDWRRPWNALESAAFSASYSMVVADDSGSHAVSGAYVTDTFFPTVAGPLVDGRGLRDTDADAVVVSERLWRGRLGGALALGRPVTIDGRAYTVVGIAAEGFQLPSTQTDLWLLATPDARPTFSNVKAGGFNAVARLAPGATVAQASAEVSARVTATLQDEHLRAWSVPLRDRLVGDARRTMTLLLVAVALVLTAASANVANLMVVRHATRVREIAVRVALGASRGRLVQQTIAEAGVLAVIGGALGVWLAVGLTRLLTLLAPAAIPRLDAVQVDWTAVACAAALSLAVTLVVGLVPALRRPPAADALRAGATTLAGRPGDGRLRSALMSLEIAASVVLLVGAMLVGRSLSKLMRTDIGASTDGVAVTLTDLSYRRTLPPDELRGLMARTLDRVAALPGVTSVAATASLPPNAARLRFTMKRIDEAVGQPSNYLVDAVVVTPGFFSTMRVPLLAGRLFTDADEANSQPVMVLSADTASALFGHRDPLGLTLSLPTLGKDGPATVTVVGVVGNVKYGGLEMAPNGAIYRPFAQEPYGSMFVVARTAGDAAVLAGTEARTISALDPAIVIYSSGTVESMVADAAASPRFRTLVLAALATVALAVAIVGLYGVVAYSVAARRREMAVRLAVGASAANVLGLVLREGLALAVVGLVAGLAASLALGRWLGSLLFEMTPLDPVSYGAAAAAMLLVALVASYLPARRAAAVDPAVTLKSE